MSHNASKWVWDQIDITGSEKLVLLRLADHADPSGGSVRPGITSVAQYTGLSERQVARYMKGFVRAGILVIDANEKGGRGRIPEYHFTFQKSDTHDTQSKTVKGDIQGHKRVTPTTPNPPERVTPTVVKGDIQGHKRVTPSVISDTDTFKEPSIEPSGTVIAAKQKRAQSKILIPEDFGISERLASWASKSGYTVEQLESQLERFRNNAAMKQHRYADWDAAFQNWMANARDWGQLNRTAPNGSMSVMYGGKRGRDGLTDDERGWRENPGPKGWSADELARMSMNTERSGT